VKELIQLENYLQQLDRAIVAFSGGVDSALLAFLARKNLGAKNVLAITGDSATVPSEDRQFVQDFCIAHDIRHQFIQTYEYDNPNYRANPENRCFFCKEELYKRLKEFAVENGFQHILDGTNTTDLQGHRPGFEALKKAEIKTPYVALGIDKASIRRVAEFLKLEVAQKPQAACLASRVPTGTPIDVAALQKIDRAEKCLRDLGIKNPRVRFHGELARLQLKQEEWSFCLEKRKEIQETLQNLGFKFVTLDLKEYDREG